METTPLDLARQRELAGALLDVGLRQAQDQPKLLESFRKHAESRRERLEPGHDARSPYMQLAYENLFRSETDFLAALGALGEAEKALVTRFSEWSAAASTASANIGLAAQGAETGRPPRGPRSCGHVP